MDRYIILLKRDFMFFKKKGVTELLMYHYNDIILRMTTMKVIFIDGMSLYQYIERESLTKLSLGKHVPWHSRKLNCWRDFDSTDQSTLLQRFHSTASDDDDAIDSPVYVQEKVKSNAASL